MGPTSQTYLSDIEDATTRQNAYYYLNKQEYLKMRFFYFFALSLLFELLLSILIVFIADNDFKKHFNTLIKENFETTLAIIVIISTIFSKCVDMLLKKKHSKIHDKLTGIALNTKNDIANEFERYCSYDRYGTFFKKITIDIYKIRNL